MTKLDTLQEKLEKEYKEFDRRKAVDPSKGFLIKRDISDLKKIIPIVKELGIIFETEQQVWEALAFFGYGRKELDQYLSTLKQSTYQKDGIQLSLFP